MKLQKQLSRKVKGKEYIKWVVVLPSKLVKNLGWKEGQEIEAEIKNKKLMLKLKK
jgi:bifunctional DNA-binding transcriptional regulator/antitoxin component of YhaV-PrlF toxin-antitoxin module